jgi:hypothetical protein
VSSSVIVLNAGEASVKKADVLARNGMFVRPLLVQHCLAGTVHLLNSVLIPSSVTLPSQRLSESGSAGRRGENELFDF